MGVCQSSICQSCVDEQAANSNAFGPTYEKPVRNESRPGPIKTNWGAEGTEKHWRIDLVSPALTEATTPASALYTPNYNGGLSLFSAFSSSKASLEAAGTSVDFATPAHQIHNSLRDLDSVIVEEDGR